MSSYQQLAKATERVQAVAKVGLNEAVESFVRSLQSPQHNVANTMELEIRFGANDGGSSTPSPLQQPGPPFTQTDYERVARTVLQHGWTTDHKAGDTMLRITPIATGTAVARVRAEINGTVAIEAYCRNNTLESVLEHRTVSSAVRQDTLYFTRKRKDKLVFFPDLEFRVSLAQETRLAPLADDAELHQLRQQWAVVPKYFRHMNRVRFHEAASCVVLDLSIVHSNRRDKNGAPIAGATTGGVGLFGGRASYVEYEIELEVDNAVVAQWLSHMEIASVIKRVHEQLHRAIRLIMGALQDSLYPVGRLERNAVIAEYMRALYSEGGRQAPLKPYFVGPNSTVLEQQHCLPAPQVPSIVENYCVTDKADGSRALLFVTESGGVYMITGALRVQFTGLLCGDKTCQHLLLDGEYITRGHGGTPLNMFAAFDLYAARSQLMMGLPFADVRYGDLGSYAGPVADRGADVPVLPPFRLPLMQHYVARLAAALFPKLGPAAKAAGNGATPTPDAACRMTVRAKEFYLGSSLGSIRQGVKSIFELSGRVLAAALEYETDGLVFTPTDTAVGGESPVFQHLSVGVNDELLLPNVEEVRRERMDFRLPDKKITWLWSFKWKPPAQNTNDFLVTVATPTALHTTLGGESVFYKKLKLLCGYNTRQAGTSVRNADKRKVFTKFMTYGTPFFDMLMDVTPVAKVTVEDRNGLEKLSLSLAAGEEGGGYKPRAFVPSTPYDLDAQFCCLPVGPDGHLRAENGDLIENATIVEFRFERTSSEKSSSWGWKPIKVRHDKTADLRAGNSEFGNPYFVANSNWKSMHYPISREIISGTERLDASAMADAVYYNTARDTSLGQRETNHLSDFHNRVVKNRMLERVTRSWRGGARTMIDFAVGKAGDLNKWKESGLQFVLGLDLSRDNIFNVQNGAISRAAQRFYDTQSKRAVGDMTVQQPPLPRCIFLPADSSKNVRSQGTAFSDVSMDRGGHRIVRALFGDQAPPQQSMSSGFVNIVAGGPEGAMGGFQIGSCQFALHYFWKSLETLHGFLRNLAECIQLGGVFVGTCYDGRRIFELLRSYAYAGPDAVADANITGIRQVEFYRLQSRESGKLLLAIAKKYSARTFESGPQSVGLAVSVFMESIDQAMDEYLVHFPYFDVLMALYGFELMSEEEMASMGFRAGEGGRRTFKSLFETEQMDPDNDKVGTRHAAGMSQEERDISFLNSLFIYRKKRTVTPDTLDALHREHVLGAPAAAVSVVAVPSTKKRPRPTAEFMGEWMVL